MIKLLEHIFAIIIVGVSILLTINYWPKIAALIP